MTIALKCNLGEFISPPLFFFLKIAFTIQGLLCLPNSFFLIVIVYEKYHWSFGRDCFESVDCLEYCRNFDNVDSSNSRLWHVFPSDCVIFNLFHQGFILFRAQVFFFVGRIIPRYFILFEEMVMEILFSLISF